MKTVSELAREVGLVLFVDSEGHCVGVTDERLIPKAVYHNDERLNKLLAPFAAAVIAQYREAMLAGVGEPHAWSTFDGEGGYDLRLFDGNENYLEEQSPRYVNWVDELYPADQLAAAIAIERERCLEIVETHRIPVGNSAAGEMACEWTYDALKTIAAAIRGQK